MCSRFIRLILLFSMLICLPIEGLASVTMPSCPMHNSKLDMKMSSTHDDMSHCGMNKDDTAPKSTSYDKCTLCYLSVAQAITMLNLSLYVDGISPMFSSLTTIISNPIPTSFYHPPRLI